MSRFKSGDRVRREGSHSATVVPVGIVTRVIPNKHGLELFSEYEVDFGADGVLLAFENQLKFARGSA